MKVLIIGFGSIGKRHFDVLSSLSIIKSITLVTKQNIENIQCFKNIKNIKDLAKYDYFIIASETNKHFEQLYYLEKNVIGKIFFCEKPLFPSTMKINVNKNKLFVGYVLRFHPLLQKMKEFIKTEKIISVNAKCGQYLPSWRPNSDYKNCYSARKEGGGVLLDLSHEIDYVQWLCGSINELKSYQVKISDLEINSDDLTMFIGKTKRDIFVNISIDYISKNTHRRLLVETLEYTFDLDFIANKMIRKDKKGLEKIYSFENLKRNYMFERMHFDILNEQKTMCTLEEGLEVMNTISIIQEQNK